MKNNNVAIWNILFIFTVLIFGFRSSAQTAFTTSPIPHQVYNANIPVQFNSDNQYSDIISLDFDFKYYGNIYNEVIIGTNGVLNFTTSLANGYCPWSTSFSYPNSFPFKNSILGCLSAFSNNSQANSGTISYSLVGSKPYRKFVLSFDNQPAYICGTDSISTFQIILYETLNTVDVQIVERQPCLMWNEGRAQINLINANGSLSLTAPGRGSGPWTATQEGWRFGFYYSTPNYSYITCENATSGIANFNLQVVKDDLDNENLNFYASFSDAELNQNAFSSLSFTNTTAYHQKIYASDGVIFKVVDLRTINCFIDYDMDNVPTISEDLNNDGNYANDNTDGDGFANFIDDDDDGDMVLSSIEYVFTASENGTATILLDTDNDGIPNYLDNDDDGDGILTIDEDYNGNNNPGDDDTNNNGTPDYLEQSVALGVVNNALNTLISVYPNPASDAFYIDNKSDVSISTITIYAISGAIVKEIKNVTAGQAIPVDELQSGVYFVRMTAGETIINHKLIKK
ncbi:T9SS type A sorting domain-containing protein [Flavobacterium sp. SM2513]|uniref:T9SS type A sorting domain-containing protein n=1 Tax=Flavobacterium sp. SM2513 TaxID=3424766 RepID=UPI003D7F2D71